MIQVYPDLEAEFRDVEFYKKWHSGVKNMRGFTLLMEEDDSVIRLLFDRRAFEDRASAVADLGAELYNASTIGKHKGQWTNRERVLAERESFRYAISLLEKAVEKTQERVRSNPSNAEAKELLVQFRRELELKKHWLKGREELSAE